jgi:DNA-binding PadR family transcriptional regulator
MKRKDGIPASSLTMELRRGVIVLAILSRLEDEHYGYSLRELLSKRGLEINEGTLYPLLRRLESQGLLDSRWQLREGRPRRYYRISQKGKKTLEEMTGEWMRLNEAMGRLLSNS